MKKLIVLILAGVLTLSLAACGSNGGTTPGSTTPATTPGSTAPAPGSTSGAAEVVGLSEAIAEQPILLTSGGQSADYQMVGTILKNLKLEYTANNVATSKELGDNKTLIVAVGGSSKGLGAAGIDADGELARLKELLDAAQAANVTVIVMHTGGAARRGDLSDKFIAPIFAYGDYAIVVKAGDEDGLMAGICADNNIPLDIVNGIGDVATILPEAFK